MLSAICQSDNIFVFKQSDQAPLLLTDSAFVSPSVHDIVSNLNFIGLNEQIKQACQVDDAVIAIHCVDKISTEPEVNLYTCAIHAEADNTLPHLILGMCIAKTDLWNEKIQNAVISLAALLQSQLNQNAKLRSVAHSESLFKEISSLSKDYIYVKDADEKVIFANQAIINLFPDSTYHEVINGKLQAVFEQHTEQTIDDIQHIVKLKGEHQREDYITHKNGNVMIVQTLTQRVHANHDSFYSLVVSRDITEREVIIKDLKRSNSDLDNFAHVASHDLKAPLNVIKRLVSWVIEDSGKILPRESLDDLHLVMSRVNRMEQLLKDLLAYSRIGREYQQASEVNVKKKVVELLSLIDLPMGFVVKCDDSNVLVPEVPFSVVLLNLIANAIKHHDSGNANIQIKVRRNQTANVVTVMDNGPGIALENRARIFDLFETLKPRDEVEGSGMGLSVVKRLVEHYGGHVKVEEHRPRGTKFIVYWPFNNLAEQVLTQLA